LLHTAKWVVPGGGTEKATSPCKTAEYFNATNGTHQWMPVAAPSPVNADTLSSQMRKTQD